MLTISFVLKSLKLQYAYKESKQEKKNLEVSLDQLKKNQKNHYGKCSKILNTFLLSVFTENVGYQGWNSQNTSQNSKQEIP